MPAQGCGYWNGEAMQGGDYKDLDEVPEVVATSTESAPATRCIWPVYCGENPIRRTSESGGVAPGREHPVTEIV
jgi:hypothetical protein